MNKIHKICLWIFYLMNVLIYLVDAGPFQFPGKENDPCFQPVGITNGLVIDRQELVISRLNGRCNLISLVFGEFYKSMTIKGIAIRGPSTITNQNKLKLPIDYAYIDANPWIRLNKSSRINAKEMKNFTYSGGGKISYHEIDDWFTMKMFRFMPYYDCFQFEFYGCPEVCSSYITYPELKETNFLNDKTHIKCLKKEKWISFDHSITLTGLRVFFKYKVQSPSVEFECHLNNNISNVKVDTILPSNSTTFWLRKSEICDAIVIKSTCLSFAMIGCNSGSISKLGLQTQDTSIAILTASGTANGFQAEYGRLNFVKDRNFTHDGWLSIPLAHSSPVYLQADFKEVILVHGIALQGTSPTAHYATKKYTISYQYNEQTIDYNNGKNIYSKFEDNKYRHLTDINKFSKPFMAKRITIHPKDCAGGSSYGCGVRWELLGSSKLLGNLPYPKIVTREKSLECVSLYVSNSNDVWWIDQKQLIKGKDFIFETIKNQTHKPYTDAYNRLKLTFLKPKLEIFKVIQDDTRRRTLYFNSAFPFECRARFDTETLIYKTNVVDYEEDTIVAYDVKFWDFDDHQKARFNWKSNTTGLFFKQHVFNISIVTENGIVQQKENLTKKEVIFLGFDPYINYTFIIQSKNKYTYSKSLEIRILTCAPTMIRDLKEASAPSSTTLHLSWKQPIPSNGKLSNYTIQYQAYFNKTVKNLVTIENEIKIQDRQPFTKYEIRVQASTRENTLFGSWSIWTLFVTAEAKPSKIQNLTITLNESSNSSFKDALMSWKQPRYANGIIKKYLVSVNGIKDYLNAFKDNRLLETKSTSIEFKLLYSGTRYSFEVLAVTRGGEGESVSMLKDTPVSEPYQAAIGLSKKMIYGQNIMVPKINEMTGPIAYYQLSIASGENSDCSSKKEFSSNLYINVDKKMETIAIRKSVKNITIGNDVFESKLFEKYQFCVRAVVMDVKTREVYGGKYGHILIERNDLESIKEQTNSSDTTIEITIPQGPNTTSFYTIIVNPKIDLSFDPKPSEVGNYDKENPDKAYISGILSTYQPTFVVGNGKVCTLPNLRFRSKKTNVGNSNIEKVSYNNVPLEDDKVYAILVQAHTNDGAYYSSTWMVTRTKETITKTDKSLYDSNQNYGLIVGVSLGILGVLVLAVMCFVFIRRKYNGNNRTDKDIKMEHMGHDNAYESIKYFQKDTYEGVSLPNTHNDHTNNLNSNVIVIVPVNLNLASHLQKMKNADSFVNEYKQLNCAKSSDWTEAIDPKLKLKNRNPNVLPYNESRVKLKKLNELNSNYINASFVHGFRSHNSYIAAQGPTKSTVNDFWQMTLEQGITVIVMTTNLVENSKKKCEKYWPEEEETLTFGEILVTSKSISHYADFIVRTFLIKKENNEDRFIQQYNFTSWLEEDIPDSSVDILKVHSLICEFDPSITVTTPLMVHGSCGVGRTGTFICIDNMLRLAAEENIIDVFNYVNYTRSKRYNLVENEKQYRFIYQCLAERSNESTKMSQRKLQEMFVEKNGKNTYQLQFEHLNSTTNRLSAEESVEGNKRENLNKNRSSILAKDNTRVVLKSSVYEIGTQSNYINAVFVSSYTKRKAFIATQHPTENTKNDFWKMVFENEIQTILLFNTKRKEHYDKFWFPIGSVLQCGELNISLLREEITVQSFILMRFEVSHRIQSHQPMYVNLINYDKWPTNNIPQKPSTVIELLETVNNLNKNSPSPLLVICSDGAERSGIFITISNIMEEIKLEHSFDVFQTIKKIRATRPEFIQNEKQYEFCYSVMKEYNESLNKYYSN